MERKNWGVARVGLILVVALSLVGCEPWVVDQVNSERVAAGLAALPTSTYLTESARAVTAEGCATGSQVATSEPTKAFGGETAVAIQELLASEPLDPADGDAIQQLMGATGRIWTGWRSDPAVTDPDWDAFGVGGFVCDGQYHLRALFRQGPELPAAGRYATFQHAAHQLVEQSDVVYGSAVDSQGRTVELKLDLFFPPDAAERASPIVLVFHGGGFVSGDKTNAHGAARGYARMGYVAAAVGYRLRPEMSSMPFTQRIAAGADAVDDAMEAVRWVKANAAGLGVDAERIAAVGFSAGGVIALALSLAEDPTPGGPLGAYDPTIAAGVSSGAPFSIAADLIELSRDDAPVMMFHFEIDTASGKTDAQERAVCEAVRAAGNICDFRVNPGSGHTVSFGPGSQYWQPDTGPFLYHHLDLAHADG